MSFTLITSDSVVTWDHGEVTGAPMEAVTDAMLALRVPFASVTPTGPWFAQGSLEHAWIILRERAPQAEVAGEPPLFGDFGDELS
jgi:hypothetical protein